MSVIGALGAAAKVAVTALPKVVAALGKIAPAVGKAISAGAIKLGASEGAAFAASKVAEVATAYVISKAVDKVTDATLEKVESLAPVGFIVDIAVDSGLIKGIWR